MRRKPRREADAVDDPEGASDRAAALERRRRRWRRVLVPLVFLSPLLIAAAAVFAWWRVQLDPPGNPGDAITVTIPNGAGVRDIGKQLAHEKVISSSFAFSVYARLEHKEKFDAGKYHLRKHLGIEAAVDALEHGPVIDYVTLRITPGLWLSEVARQVQKQMPGLSANTFLADARSNEVRSAFEPASSRSLEGFLFPDTYRFTKDDREIDVIRTMVKRFDSVARDAGLGAARAPGGISTYQAVIVASMVQEEAGTEGDRPLIASVIYNRLGMHMPLQIDATVIYALQDRKPANTAADRANPSPYNTYVHDGLPPTPIGGLAASSLKAALHPATTTYLYFVLAGTDGHSAFASTLAEHERNVQAARDAGLLK